MSAFLTLADIGDAFREAFFMFWETLWALVLGFALSGAVQAFVSKERMQRAMGDHKLPAVARASGFGMVSSSCSYAATAMAKSLFQKGADFTTAMIFMFASTNLVVELGVVLIVLLGWQFALAEFVGGPIMIAGLALVGGFVFSPKLVRAARARVASVDDAHHHHADNRDDDAPDAISAIRTRAGWSNAARFSMSDINMLRRELVVGYLVAGFLTALVPMEWWNNLFLHGHGFWTTLENVVIGPFIAVISFVCSIGNVPMAAALWHGGIGFGGVVSFVFADLITIPLLLIYRKFYGTALTLRLFATFWALMSLAGLAIEGIFSAFGAIPTNRPEAVVPQRFLWNYTTFLNIAFLAVFAALYFLSRKPEVDDASSGGGRYATDPICGMQVEKANAPAHIARGGVEEWFCSDGCRDRYETTHEIGAPPAR
ncbi:MAG TPA: permease [Acidimicrobiia bacterium]|nr:permease [Acidimicrobiia bacterium]